MLKLYHEHPEFNEYSLFDTATGALRSLSSQEFQAIVPTPLPVISGQYQQRLVLDGMELFYGQTSSTHTRFPRRIYFQITRQCNLECPACFIKADRNGTHVPFEAIQRLASFMASQGVMEVRLTGGEPTLHPQFLDILHTFQEAGVYVSIASNGVICPRILDALAETGGYWLICSLDGDRETHNGYRGDTYDRILANLHFLKKSNPALRIRITTVLTKRNMGQMWHLGEVCRQIGAESITIIPLRPQVRDRDIASSMVSADEFRKVIETMVEVRAALGVKFTTTIETDFKDQIEKDPVFTKRSSCAAGREGTNLDYHDVTRTFQVYGCSYSPASDFSAPPEIRRPFLAGTFGLEEPERLLSIWRDEQCWTIYRDVSMKSEACRSCHYLENHRCTGSCPIQNIDYGSLQLDADVLAQLRRQISETAEWYCYKRLAEPGNM
jgi:MoaA/NifB/PqqE/SkfB family radical SAM enzyme